VQDTLDQDEQLAQPRRNRAWRIHEFGGPEVLRREQVPVPSASPGQVVVGVKAVGSISWTGSSGGRDPVEPDATGHRTRGQMTSRREPGLHRRLDRG
jgi:hypothetical protein